MSGARLLATGFGPFPGAPENPTERLMHALAGMPPSAFGAHAFRTAVLPTEYRRSAEELDRIRAEFAPDVVVHFGLSAGAEALHLECTGRNVADLSKPDAVGHVPAAEFILEDGPQTIAATFPADAILSALQAAGLPAALSDDAGAYVCNATLYRSLSAARAARVGFVHVPPEGKGGLTAERLLEAATIVLRIACASQT